MIDIKNTNDYMSLFYVENDVIYELPVIVRMDNKVILRGITGQYQCFYTFELYRSMEEAKRWLAEKNEQPKGKKKFKPRWFHYLV